MGLFPLDAPVDVSIAVWEWGSYLGERARRTASGAKVSSWRRISPDSLIPHAKASGQYLNSILAKIESHKAGYEEAILLDDKGYVCEGSGENIFVVRDGRILTPPQTASILDGINRKSIIQIARDLGFEVVERDIARASCTSPTRCSCPARPPSSRRCARSTTTRSATGAPARSRARSRRVRGRPPRRAERYREWLDPVPVQTVTHRRSRDRPSSSTTRPCATGCRAGDDAVRAREARASRTASTSSAST
jgi:branched-chain amino acid aminotransferase